LNKELPILYEYNLNDVCEKFFENGFVYLPSIKSLIDQNNIVSEAFDDIGARTYSTDNIAQKKLVKLMSLEKFFQSIYERATQDLKLKIRKEDRYFVSRRVNPGQFAEKYRGHFDSHFLTIVLPIQIPSDRNGKEQRGELKIAPNARRYPKTEIINIFQKAYWKKYASEEGFEQISKKTNVITEYFDDYRPLAFMGVTTFHGNNLVSDQVEERLTFLCHLYDPSPRYGIGATLRKLRRR
tara:strand:- start:484 stop:1200 length:717 start_codon:yes stop_codon:yes gene_type:complete